MLPQPEIQANAGIYRYQWPNLKIAAMVDRIVTDGKQSLSGEVTIWHKSPGTPELLEQTRLNLSSNQARNQLAKALAERVEDVDWVNIVKYICVLTINHYRKGEPVVEIGGKPATMERAYQLHPILEKGEPTTIYGPGGTGKSYLADYVAVLVQLNQPGVYGWLPECSNVLFLDWEASQSIHERRIWAIKQGLGIKGEDKIFYRFCSQPLADDIAEIQHNVLECNASLVIIDSQVAACGDDPDRAEAASRYYNALRSLKCTTLTIDHVPKNTEGNKVMPFGSVFKWNRARSLFEVRQCQEPGEDILELGLYHRKCNEGKLLKPIGLRLEFHCGANETVEKVTFNEMDIRDVPELTKGLTLKGQIANAIRNSIDGKLKVPEIKEEVPADTSESSIRGTLNRYRNKEFVKLDNNCWGLISHEI